MPCRRYLVRGRVQGVYFRAFTSEAAARYGIVGFARNLPDGRVEVVAQGDEPGLIRFRAALGQGPASARVDEVLETELEPPESFTTFTIRS
jgi:acylphosphatase